MDLYFMGDSHGKWTSFEDTITRANISNATIIHLGDAAFGFSRRWEDIYIVSRLNNFCEKNNIILYNIRGNHDDPYWFRDEKELIKRLEKDDQHVGEWTKNDEEYKKLYMIPTDFAGIIKNLSHVKFLKDYEIINIEGLNILPIGGAISVDRSVKRKKKQHFPEEEIKYNKIVEKISGVNIVATHTCPSFSDPVEFSDIVHEFAYYDWNLMSELIAERKLMSKIYETLIRNNTINYWIYGHFHKNTNNIHGHTNFICLAPLKLYKINE